MRLTVVLLAVISCAPVALADELPKLDRAIEDLESGRTARAAIELSQLEDRAGSIEERSQAAWYLARAVERLGLPAAAFALYAPIAEAGPSHPRFVEAVEGVVAAMTATRDDLLAPNVLARAWRDELPKLSPGARARAAEAVARLQFRAGKLEQAEKILGASPQDPRGRYLLGLLQQRKDREAALATFRAVAGLDDGGSRELRELRELSHLAAARTLYAMRRYGEASAEYRRLPRFSRHWDEALFEGAYADLMNGDPGGALGRLYSLHSPHLSDEFSPESENLAAIIYQERCLHAQARTALARFDAIHVPMKERLQSILAGQRPLEEYWQMLEGSGTAKLPEPVRKHLRKNERVESMLAYLGRLERETARVKGEPELAGTPLAADLLDLLARQKALVTQLAGKFVQGRLADLMHLIEVLQGEKEIVAFETTKGEKEALEARFDSRARLDAQRLSRPEMPQSGHEYWPFDGEYWPDEIGYYRVTLKNGCMPAKDEQP